MISIFSLAAVFGGLVGFAVVIYLLFILPTQWLKVERMEHDIGLQQTVLQISDLHLERIRVSPDRLKRVIQRERPDWIALTGDFMDRGRSFAKLERYLTVFASCGCPCFAVLGNHDYSLPRPYLDRMLQRFDAFGIRVLRNESIFERGVHIVGIDDYDSHHADEDLAFRRLDQGEGHGEPVVVLTHDPNLTLFMHHAYDYLVSGHLHGKQFNVPFLFKLAPMGPLSAKGVYQGKHQCPQGCFYISKGVGQSGFNARLFVRSEVTVHRL